jgi:hypothetical protein
MPKIAVNVETLLQLLSNEWQHKPYANIASLTGLSIERLHKLTDKATLYDYKGKQF